ncbi:hypothetical protein AIOL_000742 [Candidatus Rhodobacter oscarellae]|uniref:Uncharacterized protein n=1 Tax=Candidatus Rhodobacter oscarellae TaxID=1675527 RepID=A0A0J9ECW9_9RHOB|nr:hypothetical protein [Candidatus Rhodobacter lobularis]KMW60580.1 hypothetical protein AIOL_000742 [Candidatus Rhodobacter lobularis]
MLHLLRLLLPALVPSWRFFKSIEPSPRVQWRAQDGVWEEFRPRPNMLTAQGYLRRLVWNPRWNEGLYLVSLSERLLDGQLSFSRAEILRIVAKEHPEIAAERLQFRLVFVARDGERIVEEVLYVSECMEL